MDFLIYFIFFSICLSKAKSKETPNVALLTKDMSTNLLVTLTNDTKDYKPSSVADIMNSTRKQFLYSLWHVTHYGGHDEKLIACYYTSVTYRSAMWDLRRYFQIRFLYMNTLEFEIGYLTHEIVYRYQVVLEIYQMAEKRFIPHEFQYYATTSNMLYFYINILAQCKVIIHLCNMMHELEKKYSDSKNSVFDDYFDRSKALKKSSNTSTIDEIEQGKLAHERWLKKRQQEAKKRAKERKKYQQQLQKFGITTTRRKTTPKRL